MTSREGQARALLLRITYLRIALVPVVMALALAGDRRPGAYPAAALLFVIAAVTDFFDGFLARRWSVTTRLGSFLDTTADKLLVSGALIALVAAGRASPWIAAIIVGRELVILGLRGVVATDGAVMDPSIWGKLKANVQFVAITLAMLRPETRVGRLFLDQYVMLAAGAITLLSAWDYLARWAGLLSSARR
jgi:CDP-diacylglycerol---glycerol-3-phosphate 3-phosphatidyltransferase